MSEVQVKQVRLIKGTQAQIQAHSSDILPTDIVIRTDAPDYIQEGDNVSELTNDAGYLTLSTLPVWNGGVIDVNS